jgi:hypothetical protein
LAILRFKGYVVNNIVASYKWGLSRNWCIVIVHEISGGVRMQIARDVVKFSLIKVREECIILVLAWLRC